MKNQAKEPVISIRNVGVYYRQRHGLFRSSDYWALKDISFDLYGGETLGVIGHNGVGKTTLLKVLAGIIKPSKGTVLNNNHRISLLALHVGFYPHLSGRENAVMGAMLQGLSKKHIDAKLHEVEEFSELGEFFDQPLRTYSSGMRARLGFAVAVQVDPDILLIDEVLGVGDAAFKKKSADQIKDRIRSNHTVLIVSHNLPSLKELCDRIIWIEDGKTRMEGAPDDVIFAYQEYVKQRASHS